MTFIWQDDYNIGNETIDRQHRYMFDLANEIVNPNNDQQKTHHNVLALYHYVREHFKAEAELMKKYGYWDYEEHLKEHTRLSNRLDEISSGIIRGETSRDEVMGFMRNWLLDHILGRDILLGDFLRQRNIIIEHETFNQFS